MSEEFISQISTALQPYKNVVSQGATYITIAQLLSPIFALNDMRKAKSTLGMPLMVFLFGVVFCALNIRFAVLLDDEASYNANLVGFSLSVIYTTTYFYYVSPSEKTAEMKKIVYSSALTGAILLYTKLEDPAKIEYRFGLILTCLLYAFLIFPIVDSVKTVREKCTRHLPFAMILTGVLVSLSWLLHGIIINSGFIILQNAVFFIINIIQLSFFLIYPSEPSPSHEKKGPQAKSRKID